MQILEGFWRKMALCSLYQSLWRLNRKFVTIMWDEIFYVQKLNLFWDWATVKTISRILEYFSRSVGCNFQKSLLEITMVFQCTLIQITFIVELNGLLVHLTSSLLFMLPTPHFVFVWIFLWFFGFLKFLVFFLILRCSFFKTKMFFVCFCFVFVLYLFCFY